MKYSTVLMCTNFSKAFSIGKSRVLLPVTVSTHQALAAHPVSVAFPSTHFARSLGTEGVSTRVGFPSEGAHFRVVGASRPKGTCPTFIGVVWLAIGLSSKA